MGVHFKALNESVLMAPYKIIEIFFHFESPSRPVGSCGNILGLSKRFCHMRATSSKALQGLSSEQLIPWALPRSKSKSYGPDCTHRIRGRRYYRNRTGIAIPKCLVLVSESNFAHPWVSVSVSVSIFFIFWYPTQYIGTFLHILPYNICKVLVSVSESVFNFAHPWVSKSVSESPRRLIWYRNRNRY